MSKLKYYSIKNNVFDVFNLPFVANDDKEAMIIVRNVLCSVSGAELRINRDDYSLYNVGRFNNERGTFDGKPRFVLDLNTIPIREMVKKDAQEEATNEVYADPVS